jgi:hypothetical protein
MRVQPVNRLAMFGNIHAKEEWQNSEQNQISFMWEFISTRRKANQEARWK